ncbi:luciferin-binding protein-like [Halichondria panicea]|uniref:luciferin-binding protein-like n=1 Tax=Halichondria panicea TaxID=6063 RepID=UPI00312B901F
MAYTEQQKAYHLRKMRTRAARLDINKDGFISREDYEIMSKRLAEYSKVTEEQAKKIRDSVLAVADSIKLTGDTKYPVEQFAMKISQTILGNTGEKNQTDLHTSHNALFDVIDTNGDGHISVEEFKVYLKVVAPGVTEDQDKHAFDVIDADKNGEISREEFLAAAEDFFIGVEETELAAAFMGKLVD